MKKSLLFIVACLFLLDAIGQETFPVNGVHDEREKVFALTNANIFTSHDQKLENATLLIKDGKIEGVGKGISLPANAVEIDLQGKYIYPSFIELHSNYGMPEPEKDQGGRDRKPQFISNKKGAYGWNEAIHPEVSAHSKFSHNGDQAKAYRSQGFGAVVSQINDGIARGSATCVALNENLPENESIVKDVVAACYAFDKGSSKQDYPSSLMGSIALLRQTYLDAEWYAGAQEEEYNISLDKWNKLQDVPQFFEAGSMLNILRADKVGDEFGVQYVIKGNGEEYQKLKAIKATNASLIIPLNFPDAYDVEDPFDALNVSLQQMKHWELAPTNPARLAKADVKFALTTDELKDKSKFTSKVAVAMKNGLSHEDALKALTTTPAELAGLTEQLGSLMKGKLANFVVSSDSLFKDGTVLHDNWVKGERFVLKPFTERDLTGAYDLKVDGKTYAVEVTGKPAAPKFEIVVNDSTRIPLKHTEGKGSLGLSFKPSEDAKGKVRLSGWADGKNWKGRGQKEDGSWMDWSLSHKGEVPKKEDKKEEESKDKKDDKEKKEEKKEDKLGEVTHPFLPFGWTEEPEAETVIFKNATIWTNEDDGILEEADLVIRDGKISQVGTGLSISGAREVDCKGKHVTSGIIDEHSHIAISYGVNEGTQASSAEVRIGDVVNSEDVNIYRQLSGGVVASQLLHGSANPIGGQSALIKLRWGSTPEEMKIKNAVGFIKFALGENVKQSNWGDNNVTRFPQTRMGVEQVYMDHFTRAREYESARTARIPARKDLEMEALLEILNKKRFITCHSYVQSEINMLMKVAEHFDFTLNTFTHILEGYKLADKMQKHGAAGSTFSDWWAYKYEVIDAIPHNGAILHEMGVVTAFNSDDAEMARRLNQEAAKAVKYGGVSEEEAWKFVTLNPAKMLHLDKDMGSLKVGKAADVVVWSEHPMSQYAMAEMTFVDGVCYFDRAEDLELRKEVQAERNRLIQKMLAAKSGGAPTQKPHPEHHHHYHCDDLDP